MLATKFIANNAGYTEDLPEYPIHRGRCSFCGEIDFCVRSEDIINEQYFSDSDLMVTNTGFVCQHCAHCMATRSVKQGHWIASPSYYESVSTADLPNALAAVRAGDAGPPVAIHISEDPIRSEHAYLWTPVAASIDSFQCSYADQEVRIGWEDLTELVHTIEDCRWHGMRLDDIRADRPRIADLDSMGEDAYRRADDVIDQYRGTPTLELAITLSNSATDQTRPRTNGDNTTLDNYVNRNTN